MIGEPSPIASKQAVHAEQIRWGGQPIKSARAIDFYPFYHICEQNAFIVGKEEPLPMHLSLRSISQAQACTRLAIPRKGNAIKVSNPHFKWGFIWNPSGVLY